MRNLEPISSEQIASANAVEELADFLDDGERGIGSGDAETNRFEHASIAFNGKYVLVDSVFCVHRGRRCRHANRFLRSST